LVAPVIGRHVLAPHCNQSHARLFKHGCGIIPRDVTLVAIKARLRWQDEGQLMDRREVVKARGPEGETHRHALWGADQMQSPAEELFFLGRAMTAEIKPAH